MSGHSRWHKIQFKKGKIDKARGNLFTKLCKAITVAAQEGGGDADMNFSLRLAIEKAKAGNVPKDNIERAIKKGTGEGKDHARLEEIVYEGFGPQGVAFLIETVTDNKNRTVAEVKHCLSKYGGSLGGPGSVQWQFQHMGIIRLSKESLASIQDTETLDLSLIDAGAQDIIDSEFGKEVRIPKEAFKTVLTAIEQANLTPEDSGLEWIAKEEIALDKELAEKIETLHSKLDELDDVKAIYTNEK